MCPLSLPNLCEHCDGRAHINLGQPSLQASCTVLGWFQLSQVPFEPVIISSTQLTVRVALSLTGNLCGPFLGGDIRLGRS